MVVGVLKEMNEAKLLHEGEARELKLLCSYRMLTMNLSL